MMESILNFAVTFIETYGLWFMFGIIAAGLILFIFFEDYKKEIPRKTSVPLVTVFIILPAIVAVFFFFINPYYCGYGYSTGNFKVIAHKDAVLLGLDNRAIPSAGVGDGSSVYYKIQAVNISTGKKIFTKLVQDEFEFKGQHENLIWAYSNNEYVGIDILTGKTMFTINEKTLTKQFSKLSSGVYEYSYNAETALFDILSKDGVKMSIDPIANKEVTGVTNVKVPASYYLDNYSVSDSLKKNMIKFLKKGERQQLVDSGDKKLNPQLVFLNGAFLLFDERSKKLFILSYETLENKNFILRCVTTAGKLDWERKQSDLGVKDFFNDMPKYGSGFFFDDALILSFDGFVFSLNAANGKLNWLTRV